LVAASLPRPDLGTGWFACRHTHLFHTIYVIAENNSKKQIICKKTDEFPL
jgi:hypothetical protein